MYISADIFGYIGLHIITREKQGNVSLAFNVQWKEVANYLKVVVY